MIHLQKLVIPFARRKKKKNLNQIFKDGVYYILLS